MTPVNVSSYYTSYAKKNYMNSANLQDILTLKGQKSSFFPWPLFFLSSMPPIILLSFCYFLTGTLTNDEFY